jgi:hypothetical protein
MFGSLSQDPFFDKQILLLSYKNKKNYIQAKHEDWNNKRTDIHVCSSGWRTIPAKESKYRKSIDVRPPISVKLSNHDDFKDIRLIISTTHI